MNFIQVVIILHTLANLPPETEYIYIYIGRLARSSTYNVSDTGGYQRQRISWT